MTAIDDRMMGVFENLEVPEGVEAELIRGQVDLLDITLDTSEFQTYS
ncbi:hypothetical protein ACFU7Y_11070 [Kitasatospora sp. NPDC057542]|nr:hypothetical protein [Streptomyces sp. LS1784]